MNSILTYIREVGINDAFGLWRLRLSMECSALVGDSAPINFPQTSLREIVQHEHELRKGGSEPNFVAVWMVIDGTLDEVHGCAEWVRQQCSDDEEVVFDFLTTDQANGEFLDGSLSLVLPAAWEPTGVLGSLGALASRFPGLTFSGSALEFTGNELQPWSGSKFTGVSGQFRFERHRFDRDPGEAQAA